MKIKLLVGSVLIMAMSWAPGYAQIPNPTKIAKDGFNKLIKKKDKPSQEAKPAEAPKAAETNPPANNAAQTSQPPAFATYSKFDFVPGEKVLFNDDFSNTAIGDFPEAWNTNGSGEVVTSNLYPGQWLQHIGRGSIWTDALLDLPENYTIEFDVIPIKGEEGGMAGWECRLIQSINAKAFDAGAVPGKAGLSFGVEYFGRPYYRTYINGNEGEGLGLTGSKEDKSMYEKMNQEYHISIWIQKSRVRIYQNENKIFDLPRAFPLPSVKMDRFRFDGGASMVTNIRIAVGNPDTRSKLLTEGKLVSYGIYFDVNKDVVKPESYGTLKEIAAVLKDNPGIRIKIVGHTDSDGSDQSNLDLSKRRALAVKNELVNSFGLEGTRIETDGKGEAEPIAPNDTNTHKALNRRVEFIKI